MRLKTKQVFLSNFILMLLSVFVPCVFFCSLLSILWTRQAQKDAFSNEETMLSLASRTFDTVLRDVTLAIGLMETDEQLTASLYAASGGLRNLPASSFLSLNTAWNDTVRVLLAKPYVSNVYLYLEQYPDFVFTDENIRLLEHMSDTRWLDAYRAQDPGVSLWTQSLDAASFFSKAPAESIYISRRLPYLHWDDELRGVITVRLEDSYFHALFDDLPQNTSRNIFILDDKFTQLFSLHTGTYTQYLQDEDILFGECVNFTRRTQQGDILVSVVNSSAFNWSYISVLPLSDISNRFLNLRRLAYLFIAIALLVSLCLASFITHRNYKPIRFMVQIIDNYRQNGTLTEDDHYSGNEYGYVIHTLIRTLTARQEAEKNLAIEKMLQEEASLLALQAQINPHFLYNTLEIINWEAIDLLGTDNNISRMLLCLSSNLRYATHKSGRFVTLREDLENLSQYITIQKLFTEDRISFSYRIDEALLDRRIPKLLLQPLVENALIHGLSKAADGSVRIRIQDCGNGIKLRVLDNGAGFSPEALSEVRANLEHGEASSGTCLGLKNIDSRLKLLYGKEFGLKIFSIQNRGTCIQAYLPGAKS